MRSLYLVTTCLLLLILTTNSLAVMAQGTVTPTPTRTIGERVNEVENQLQNIEQALSLPTPTLLAENRISQLETEVEAINNRLQANPKDFWDKAQVVSSLLGAGSTIILTLLGIFITDVYRKRQEELDKINDARQSNLTSIEIVQGFMPHLQSDNPKEVEGALLAIRELGNEQLAVRFARLYESEGALSALLKIISQENPQNLASAAREAVKTMNEKYHDVLSSVVLIRSNVDTTLRSTGFIINDSGVLLTTEFAINDEPDISVVLNDGTIIDRPIAEYIGSRLAKITIESSQEISARNTHHGLELSESIVTRNEEVLILGNHSEINELIVIEGTIIDENVQYQNIVFLTVRLSVAPKSLRGAPVLNQSHQVVGLLYRIEKSSEGFVGYILPSSLISAQLT